MMTPFKDIAITYFEKGLVPVPLGDPKSTDKSFKSAFQKGWQKFARNRYSRDELISMVDKFGQRNVGLCTGSIILPGLQLVGVDIDDESKQDNIERALPALICGKRGKKGATWFFLAPDHIKSGKRGDNAVDFLAYGAQTVIPPSYHSWGNCPYVWLTKPLHEIDIQNLPIITEAVLDEIDAVGGGRGVYFVGGTLENGQSFPGLNNIEYLGEGEGGNLHHTVVASIAHLVSRGWKDDEIIARVDRAQREAVESGGFEYDWTNADREIQNMIDSARSKGFGENADKMKGGKGKAPQERTWGEWLLTQYDNLTYSSGTLYHYEDGHYKTLKQDQLTSKVVKSFTSATESKAVAAFNVACLLSHTDEFGVQDRDMVCLLNGTLDVESFSLKPWSPDDQLTYRLDIEFDPNATCDEYDKFIKWVFSGDEKSINSWDEFCGLTLVPEMKFQKSMWLLGTGRNGKSTLSNLLTKIHHHSMVANVPITNLDNERHITSLVGKYINVSSEQSRLNTVSDTMFKAIIGQDPVPVRRLYAEVEHNIELNVRFLILANELPATNDSSDAFRRRMILLQCPNTVSDEEADPKLFSRLMSEKAGIFNRWVKALNRLRVREHFDEPETSKKAVADYLSSNDPVSGWVSSMLVKDSKHELSSTEAYANFSDWAKMIGFLRPLPYPAWCRRMETYGFKLMTKNLNGLKIGYFEAKMAAGKL